MTAQAPVGMAGRRVLKRFICISTAAAFLCQLGVPIAAQVAHAQSVQASATGGAIGKTARSLPDNCVVESEDAFRQQIEAITLEALRDGLASVSMGSLVDTQWRENGVDQILDKQVDKAIAEVRDESSWGQLIGSIASKDKARRIAEMVAERVYKSSAFKAAIEDLAGDVGQSVSGNLELATLDAALPAMSCVRDYLGSKYGAAIAGIVSTDTRRQFDISKDNAATVDTGDVLFEGKGLIAGTVILMVRRTLSRMARRIGQRVAGAVLSRLVAVVAGGVGLVLIAKDIWDLRYGILPIVATEMKSEDSKEKVRAEVATVIQEQLDGQLGEVASGSAERILETWREFRRNHAKVVELSEKQPQFQAFLDTVPPAEMRRAERLVGIALAREGEDGVRQRLENGTLQRAVNVMPAAGLTIAGDTQSIDTALAWSELAGDQLENVVGFDMHRTAKPEDFSREQLSHLISLDDRLAIGRLVSLDRQARTGLLSLDRDRLVRLARTFDSAELAGIADYIAGLSNDARIRMLQTVSDTPSLMKALGRERVRSAIISSRDQNAAVGMMVRPSSLIDLSNLQQDTRAVIDGDVHALLLWERHPVPVAAAGLLLLMILMIFNRLLFGRRRRTA